MRLTGYATLLFPGLQILPGLWFYSNRDSRQVEDSSVFTEVSDG